MEYILAIMGILVTVTVAYSAIPEFRKYIPFSSKPLLRICYHKQHASDLNPEKINSDRVIKRRPTSYFNRVERHG